MQDHIIMQSFSVQDETPPRRCENCKNPVANQTWNRRLGTPLKESKLVYPNSYWEGPWGSHGKSFPRTAGCTSSRKFPHVPHASKRQQEVNERHQHTKNHSAEGHNLSRNSTNFSSTFEKKIGSTKRNQRETVWPKGKSVTSHLVHRSTSSEKDAYDTLTSDLCNRKPSTMNRSSKKKPDASAAFTLDTDLVVRAITSLYIDRIHPFLVDILQRVKLLAKQSIIAKCDGSDSSTISQYLQSLSVHSIYNCIQERCASQFQLVYIDDTGTRRVLKADSHTFEKGNKITQLLKNQSSMSTSTLSRIEAQLIHSDIKALPPVDPRSLDNPYSLDVWRSFFSFLVERLRCNVPQHLSDRGGLLPYQFKGGRYGMAVELKNAAGHPHLQNLSLGELCHVVQLAITGRLLAYEKSVLQPVASCVDLSSVLLRLTCSHSLHNDNNICIASDRGDVHAESVCNSVDTYPVNVQESEMQPYASEDNEKKPSRCFESIDEVVCCLSELFEAKPEGYVIAQLKQILFTRYGKEIMPEKFGYRKLTECLRLDPAISSLCHIVSMDSSAHRLLVVPRGDCSKKTLLSSPVSPSTMASSLSCVTHGYESPVVSTNPQISVSLPDGMMDPPNASRCITYNAWKFFPYDRAYTCQQLGLMYRDHWMCANNI